MLRMAPMSKNWTFEFTLNGAATGMNPSTPPKIVATMLLPQGKELRLQLRCGVDHMGHFTKAYRQLQVCYYELAMSDLVDYPINISAKVEEGGDTKYALLSDEFCHSFSKSQVKLQSGNLLPLVALMDQTPTRDGRTATTKRATFNLLLTIHFPQLLTDAAEVFVSDQIANLRIHSEQIGSLLAEGKFGEKDCKVVAKDGNVHDYHKVLLGLKSEVFKMAFDADLVEGKTNLINVDCDSDTLGLVTPYFYEGKMPKITKENAMELYRLAHLYHIEGLRAFVAEEIMLKANQLVEVSNVLEFVVFAENFDLKVFKQFCLEFINGNRSGVVNLAEWEDFNAAHFNLVKQLLLL